MKREYHDENVFLKVDRASSKMKLVFSFEIKKKLVTFRKCNSHLQYYKINLIINIKLQEINFNVCEEYKIESDDRIACNCRLQRL